MKNPFISDGYTGQMPMSVCPVCFHQLDGTTNMTGKDEPRVGDFTVCVYCRSVLRFGLDMILEESSLMQVPVEIRFAFAKLIRTLESMPPPKGK